MTEKKVFIITCFIIAFIIGFSSAWLVSRGKEIVHSIKLETEYDRGKLAGLTEYASYRAVEGPYEIANNSFKSNITALIDIKGERIVVHDIPVETMD